MENKIKTSNKALREKVTYLKSKYGDYMSTKNLAEECHARPNVISNMRYQGVLPISPVKKYKNALYYKITRKTARFIQKQVQRQNLRQL